MNPELEDLLKELNANLNPSEEELEQERLEAIWDVLETLQDNPELSRFLEFVEYSLDPDGNHELLEKIGTSANIIKGKTIYGIRLTGDMNDNEFLYLNYFGVFYGKSDPDQPNSVHQSMIFASQDLPVEVWIGAVKNTTATDITERFTTGLEGVYSKIAEKFHSSENIQP